LNTFNQEIKSLLDRHENLELVAEEQSLIEKSDFLFDPQIVNEFCNFLICAGFYKNLVRFVLNYIHDPNFQLPWPYFIEAIAQSKQHLSDLLVDELMHGITQTDQLNFAAKSHGLDLYVSSLKVVRADQKIQKIKLHKKHIEDLFDQLATLRTQQLVEQERALLKKLEQLDPNNPEIIKEISQFKNRQALEILDKHSRIHHTRTYEWEDQDEEVDALLLHFCNSLKDHAQTQPSLAKDLAVAAAMIEQWPTSLECLRFAIIEDKALHWLRLEILAKTGRHLELLNAIPAVEAKYALNPETAYATTYLRAIALYGIGQIHQAIEILETLAIAKPNYRSAASLLNIWRSK
jgi:tetratricopeptide (TPR) repeat protein